MNVQTMLRSEGVVGLAMLIMLATALAASQAHDGASPDLLRATAGTSPAALLLVAPASGRDTSSQQAGLRRFTVTPLPAGLGVDLDLGGRIGRGAGGSVSEL